MTKAQTTPNTKKRSLEEMSLETKATEVKFAARLYMNTLKRLQTSKDLQLSQQTLDMLEERMFSRISHALRLTKLEMESFSTPSVTKRGYHLPKVEAPPVVDAEGWLVKKVKS